MAKKVHVQCMFPKQGEPLRDILRRSLVLFLQRDLHRKAAGPDNPAAHRPH